MKLSLLLQRTNRACAVLGAALTFAASAFAGNEPPLAIRASKVWVGDGRVLNDATVLIENGRIAAVGTDLDLGRGVEVIEHKGSLSAGMIALHGWAGPMVEMADGTRTSMPEARVVWAFDPAHADFEPLRSAGITSLLMAPAPYGVTAGVAAVVKTSGRTVLSKESHLSLVFSSQGLSTNREPTSYGGALALLEQLFVEPKGVVESARAGKLPVLFEAQTRADVQRALEFAKKHSLRGMIHGAAWAGEQAKSIAEAKLAVVVPAFDVGFEGRSLRSVATLAKEGVRFGFGLGSPQRDASSLRLGAAACVRDGLDPNAAWNALTSDAARIAGVDARVGRIEKGLDADLVLWSGDPLELSSRVEVVLVDGVRVAGGQE